LEDVSLIGPTIATVCQNSPLDEVEGFQVEVSVVEAVNNSIRHAYSGESGHAVEVDIVRYEDRIEFEISDWGQPMKRLPDFDDVTLDYDPTDRQNLPTGGMGLFIMHDVMDRMSYESRDGKNMLSFTKRFERETVE